MLGLQGLYRATNCADSILWRFTIILQNQIARVDSFTNLTKRWVFRFRLNASISSHNLISFGKQFHAWGPYTANASLPNWELEFWNLQDTFFIGSYGISFAFWWGDHFMDVGRCLAIVGANESAWWLLMCWCLFGATTSATIVMTSPGWPTHPRVAQHNVIT